MLAFLFKDFRVSWVSGFWRTGALLGSEGFWEPRKAHQTVGHGRTTAPETLAAIIATRTLNMEPSQAIEGIKPVSLLSGTVLTARL